MKWEKKKLCECTEYITDGDHQPAPKADKGVHFIKIKDIVNNQVSFDAQVYVPQEYYDNLPMERKPQKEDVLYTVVGSFGIPSYVQTDELFCFERNIALLHPNKDIEPRFLYYSLKNPAFYKGVEIVANGSAQKLIPLSKLKDLKISVPDKEAQRHIADILSVYDDLIENNQKQIKLLEEAAQRLYKEWFVDLRFPGHENTKIVDGVPEGWSKSTVGNICKLRKVVITPDKIESNTPYIGLEHMPRNDICLSTWGKSEEINSNKFIYLKKDVLFGKIRPYFHKVGFALNDGITSTDTMVMVADQNLWGLLLVTVSSDAFVDFSYQNCKEGAKMPRADWKQMEKYAIMIADQATQKLFEQEILVITNKISALAFQCRSLREARDRMLPKLMGGEVEA
jgi:type I restriction enzyme S subunit